MIRKEKGETFSFLIRKKGIGLIPYYMFNESGGLFVS